MCAQREERNEQTNTKKQTERAKREKLHVWIFARHPKTLTCMLAIIDVFMMSRVASNEKPFTLHAFEYIYFESVLYTFDVLRNGSLCVYDGVQRRLRRIYVMWNMPIVNRQKCTMEKLLRQHLFYIIVWIFTLLLAKYCAISAQHTCIRVDIVVSRTRDHSVLCVTEDASTCDAWLFAHFNFDVGRILSAQMQELESQQHYKLQQNINIERFTMN